MADLEELAGLAGGEDHGPGLVERVRHLLFAIDRQPGPEAGVGVLGVDPVGGGDDGGLEALFRGQEVAIVLVDGGDVAVLLEVVPGVLPAVGPDVADGRDADPGNAQHRFDEHAALGAAADDGHAELVGAFRGGRRGRGGGLRRVLPERRSRQGGAEPGRGRGSEEIPAADPRGRRGLDGTAHDVTPASVEAASSYYKTGLPKKRKTELTSTVLRTYHSLASACRASSDGTAPERFGRGCPMRCPHCQFENPDDSRFCGNCAALLRPVPAAAVRPRR